VVGGDAQARVTAVYEASLVDISTGGALIEHAHIVRPGTMSYLILKLKGRDVSVQCRVVRSVVHRPEMDAEGEQVLVYRTGLEYVDLSDETLRLLDEYIVTGMEGSHGPRAEP
jgi:hypothetical protein